LQKNIFQYNIADLKINKNMANITHLDNKIEIIDELLKI
jgi:hypothetical protein